MTTTTPIPLPARAFAALRRTFTGELLQPAHPAFDEQRRIWNRMIDRRPALIARCTVEDDIRRAFAFARDAGLPVSVRGGGHNVAGSAVLDGGVMIDCSLMRAVSVKPATRLVDVQPGTLLGDLDAATAPHGLAVAAGIVTETGVAGLTLGGGIGWLMRRDGLTCDRLREADLLTADGELRTVDTATHPDLFWALRGGGGNFGIVTRFRFDAAPLGVVRAGLVLFPLEGARDILGRYRDWAARLPREATTILALRSVPPLPTMPRELHGRRVLAIGFCHTGAHDEGERLAREISGLASTGRVLLDTIGPKRFAEHQSIFDTSIPSGFGYYWKSHFLENLNDPAIETLVEHSLEAPQPWSYAIIFQMGGAIADVAPDATAFSARDAGFAVNINGVAEFPEDDAAVTAWTRRLFGGLTPYATGGVYVNFVGGDEGDDRVRAAYGDAYARLADVKARWDPENVFRANQNVRPAAG